MLPFRTRTKKRKPERTRVRSRRSGPRYRGSNPCLPANRHTSTQVAFSRRFDGFDPITPFMGLAGIEAATCGQRPGNQ
jgi:hypothetical protein